MSFDASTLSLGVILALACGPQIISLQDKFDTCDLMHQSAALTLVHNNLQGKTRLALCLQSPAKYVFQSFYDAKQPICCFFKYLR